MSDLTGLHRVCLAIPDEYYEALKRKARKDDREPKHEAAYLLKEALKREVAMMKMAK